MEEIKKDEVVNFEKPALGRRDIMKLGVGAGVAAAGLMAVPASAFAQGRGQGPQASPPTGPLAPASQAQVQHFPEIRESDQIIMSTDVGYSATTHSGWVNNSGRASGNGPMDECSRRIVEYVSKFDESKL